MRTSKRNSDKRKVREAKTYSVPEIATMFDKSESTVTSWIKTGGLETIDDLNPPLVFGYVLKAWHNKWRDARKKPSSPETIYCMKCRVQRSPAEGSIRVEKTLIGGLRVRAKCEVSGTEIFKTVKAEDLDALYRAAAVASVEQRFNDSDTSTIKPPPEANFAVQTREGVEKAHELLLPCNPFNERLKFRYYQYLHQAAGKSALTVRATEDRLMRFESFFKFRNFGTLSKEEAMEFKQSLREGPLSGPVVLATIEATKSFLAWLRDQRGVPRRLTLESIAYLNLTAKERRMAMPIEKIRVAPKFNDLEAVIKRMPATTLTERRNRAVLTLLAVTGARAGVLPTLRFKHLDAAQGVLYQVGSEVNTKFGKNIPSILAPIRPGLVEIILSYEAEMRVLGFTDSDPLFPKASNWMTKALSDAPELSFEPFSDAQVFGRMVRDQFVANGFPPFTIHSVRHAYGRLLDDQNISIGVARAISANLGHKSLRVTTDNYGRQNIEQRQELILGHFSDKSDNGALLEQIKKLLLP